MKICVGILLFISSTFGFTQELKEGIWTGQIRYSSVRIPFAFEVQNSESGPPRVTLINGQDRQRLTNIKIDQDSIFMPLDPFDAVIRAKFSATAMTGVWRKNYSKEDVSFSAGFGGVTFQNTSKEFHEIERKWRMDFNPRTSDKFSAIGLFDQEGNQMTGTILTELGDYRFFEGILDGDSIKISSFDGVHAFLMQGVKTSSGWAGKLYFDEMYSDDWVASYDADVELEDPFEIITIKKKKDKPYFDLLGAGSGKNAIDPTKYAGKVVIIQVFGTWCPNSLDQTKFLVTWYKSKKDGVEIVASTYEPNYSRSYGLQRINDYKKNLDIPYDVYLGGKLSKANAAFPFPFMRKINAFPTLVVLDKNGFARYVHSYFNGPATGEYYEAFGLKLDQLVEELLNE